MSESTTQLTRFPPWYTTTEVDEQQQQQKQKYQQCAFCVLHEKSAAPGFEVTITCQAPWLRPLA